MFHMLHDFCCKPNLPHSYHGAMFPGMRNKCCILIFALLPFIRKKVWTDRICECCICMFQWQMAWWHRWCTCLWNEMQLCGSQTPRVLQPSPLIKISPRDLKSVPFWIKGRVYILQIIFPLPRCIALTTLVTPHNLVELNHTILGYSFSRVDNPHWSFFVG